MLSGTLTKIWCGGPALSAPIPSSPLQPLGLLFGYQMLSSKKTRSYSLDPLLRGDSLLGPFSGSLEVIGLPAPPWALGRRQGKEPDLPYLCCLTLSSPLKLISHVKIAPAPPATTTGPKEVGRIGAAHTAVWTAGPREQSTRTATRGPVSQKDLETLQDQD